MSEAVRLRFALLVFLLVWGTRVLVADEPADGTQPVNAAPAAVALSTPGGWLSLQDLAEKVKQSVVVVTFDGRDGERQGLGSGFIVDSSGLIATNLHVIGEARPITVQLADNRKFEVVAIEATDKLHDLAVLRIEARDLPAIPLGDSDALRDGEALVAVGNPLGLERSVVTGILSGRREVDDRPMLQLSMPIERGNSGGPVLDHYGRVQGLVTLKSLKTDNLGFAAPVNALKPLLTDPNPIAMSRWLTIGVLNPETWIAQPGARWKQRAGRILVEGTGAGFGGRALCWSTSQPPAGAYELGVTVRFEPDDGAAGLAFEGDKDDRHYGFYRSHNELRLSRFDGPDVYAWTVLKQVPVPDKIESDWHRLKVRVEPDRLLCYYNGQLVFDVPEKTYRGGRPGLCKFRNTKAEFRDFLVAESLPEPQAPAELLAAISSSLAEEAISGTSQERLIAQLVPSGDVGLQALEREARRLERKAKELRELGGRVHEERILKSFQELAEQPAERLDLLRGCLLIAAMDNPELDISAYQEEVERIARRIQSRLKEGDTAPIRLKALQTDLFEEQGYHGSRQDYDHRSNSYLNEVMDDREGLPITLSILFMEVGRRVGVPLEGVALPGHFVVRFCPADGPGRLIDVFDRGSELTAEAAKARVLEATGGEWNDEYLARASNSAILVRVLRNLFSEARRAQDLTRMLRYTNLVLILQPDSASDHFYRAVLGLETGRLELARTDIDWLNGHPLDGLSRSAVNDLTRAVERAEQERRP